MLIILCVGNLAKFRKCKFKDQEKLHFVSFATVHWVDLFVRPEYWEVLFESLRYSRKEKVLELYK